MAENEDEALGKGRILEEFKEIDEVRGLIDNLKDIFSDQIAVETTIERFTCKNYCVLHQRLKNNFVMTNKSKCKQS